MRTKSLVIGYVFALALFLFAQRHPAAPRSSDFHGVVDLTASVISNPIGSPDNAVSAGKFESNVSRTQSLETRLDAPATLAKSLWTVDQIPPERLIAPLVVLDVRDSVKRDADYQLSVIDIANWERTHGEIPLGSVVMALTGSTVKENSANPNRTEHSAGYSTDAAKFLIEGRNAVGLGIDSRNIDSGLSKDHPVYKYSLSRSTYVLENVAELDRAPAYGGIVMVAPAKLENRVNASVRILALAR